MFCTYRDLPIKKMTPSVFFLIFNQKIIENLIKVGQIVKKTMFYHSK